MHADSPLVMTPLIEQATHILKANRRDLEALVAEALVHNPLLQLVADPDDAEGELIAVVTPGRQVRALSGAALKLKQEVTADDDTEQHRRSAAWLIKALERRVDIIRRLVEHLTERSGSYLDGAAPAPQKAPASEIAQALGVHASTVKMVVANKALRCPAGVVWLEELIDVAL